MKKLLLISIIALLFSCGEDNEQAEVSMTDSISAAIDLARANDTLLIKLQKENK